MKKLTYVLSFILVFLSFGVITKGQWQSWEMIKRRRQKGLNDL